MGDMDWERLRITQGRPAVGAELTEAYNPLEAGLCHAVSVSKGCYIGQETIAKVCVCVVLYECVFGWEVCLLGRGCEPWNADSALLKRPTVHQAVFTMTVLCWLCPQHIHTLHEAQLNHPVPSLMKLLFFVAPAAGHQHQWCQAAAVGPQAHQQGSTRGSSHHRGRQCNHGGAHQLRKPGEGGPLWAGLPQVQTEGCAGERLPALPLATRGWAPCRSDASVPWQLFYTKHTSNTWCLWHSRSGRVKLLSPSCGNRAVSWQVPLENLIVAVDGQPARVTNVPYPTRQLPTAEGSSSGAAASSSDKGTDLQDRAAAAK